MLIHRQTGPSPLLPGHFRLDANPLRVHQHAALWQRELDEAIESCVAGQQHADALIPELRQRQAVVAMRVKQRLRQSVSAGQAYLLCYLLARIGVLDGVQGLADLLAVRDRHARLMAAFGLAHLPIYKDFSKEQVRAAIEQSQRGLQGLRVMLFDPDRLTRKTAVEVCERLGIDIADGDCERLLADKPDVRGETSTLVQYVAARGKDLGAFQAAVNLLSLQNENHALVLAGLASYLKDPAQPLHDRVVDLLEHFIAANLTPIPEHLPETIRFNNVANAVRALSWSRSPRALVVMRDILEKERTSYPRACVWQALMARIGLERCRALLESSEPEKTIQMAIDGLFSSMDPSWLQERMQVAQDVLDAPWAARMHEQAAGFLRRHRSRSQAAEDSLQRKMKFEEMTAASAARHLVEIGVLSDEEVERVLSSTTANGAHSCAWEVLGAASLITVIDVESPDTPPHYSRLLERMAQNSRGHFNVTAVRQDWYSDGEQTVGVVQCICNDRLLEFAVRDRGDYYDMRSVLAAANHVLDTTGAAQRFIPASGGDQILALLFCSVEQGPDLANIVGLPIISDPDEPMNAGRRFEQIVRGG